MLPLVMPCEARNPSSVCTSTSKIALPIPRTSYFAAVIYHGPVTAIAMERKIRFYSDFRKVLRPNMIGPTAASDGATGFHDPLLPHGFHGYARVAAARLPARRHDRSAVGRRSRGRCLPGSLSTG